MKNKTITLYHYSDNKIYGRLLPGFFGANYYTNNDKNVSNIKRIFFYLKPIPEFLLQNSKYLYISKIKNTDIYDLRKDKKQLIQKYNNIDILLRYIKNKYNGAIYTIGNIDICIIFKPIKIYQTKIF